MKRIEGPVELPSELKEEIEKKEEEIYQQVSEFCSENDIPMFMGIIAWPLFDYKGTDWKNTTFKDRDWAAFFMTCMTDDYVVEGDSDEDLQKMRDVYETHIMCARRSMNILMQIDKDARQKLGEIDAKLGYDKAKMYPILPETDYFIFTEMGQYRVRYETPDMWKVTLEQGLDASPPSERLHFIGNLQEDGTIFYSGDMPIISSGDKLVFGFWKDREIPVPVFVTAGVVKIVVKVQNLN